MLKVEDQLDQEWVELILEALEMGISEEDIKTFLREHTQKVG